MHGFVAAFVAVGTEGNARAQGKLRIEDAQERDDQEDADPACHGIDQYIVGDGSDLICQHLQIRFGNRDDRAHEKANEHGRPQFISLDHPAADALAKWGHCQFGAKLKDAHSDDEQHGPDQKQQQGPSFHRDDRRAQQKDDDGDRQNAGQGFPGFLF